MPSENANRRIPVLFAMVMVLGLLLAACTERHFFPVKVDEVTVSPIYQLEVGNETSGALVFHPIREFRPDYKPKRIDIGGHITCLLQIAKIKVGETFAHEIVEGPYINSGRLGPDRAYLQYRDGKGVKCDVVIDISSVAWFEPYTVKGPAHEAKPRTISIVLTDSNLNKNKWFAGGPYNP